MALKDALRSCSAVARLQKTVSILFLEFILIRRINAHLAQTLKLFFVKLNF
jgi:hypothetical protein